MPLNFKCFGKFTALARTQAQRIAKASAWKMEVAWRKGAQPSIKLPLQSRNRTAIAATEPLASIALSQFALNEPLGGGTHLQKVGEILWEAWAT